MRAWQFQYQLRVAERDGYSRYVRRTKRKAIKRWRRNLIILSKLHLLAIKRCKPLIAFWRKKISNIRCIRKIFRIYEAAWNYRIDNNIWNSPSMNMCAILRAWSHYAYMEKCNRIDEQNIHKALVFRATSLLATHFVLWNTAVIEIRQQKAIEREEERQKALILQERREKENRLRTWRDFVRIIIINFITSPRHKRFDGITYRLEFLRLK
jgi:FlaA1/EpsC-like NDP-sugar epimerase